MVSVTFDIPEQKVNDSSITLVARRGWRWYQFIGVFWPLLLASQIYMLTFYLSIDAHTWQFAFAQVVTEPAVRLAHAVFSTLVVFFVLYVFRGTTKLLRFVRRPDGTTDFEPERMRAGSVLAPAKLLDFQAEIFGLHQGTWVRSGQCFRTNTFIVTAHHVIDNYEKVRLVTSRGHVEVQVSDFRQLEGDLSILLVTDAQLAPLGLTKAKLASHEAVDNSGLFVKVSGFGQSSLGMLRGNPSFGFCEYTGSTVSGFSGAPYVVGKTVYGMHLGGGTQNLGYSGAYISMLLRTLQEDSTDFLMTQIKKTSEYQVMQSPYDPDEFRVKVGGRYYLLDAEGVHKLNMRVNTTASYQDYEPESLVTEVEQLAKPRIVPTPTPKVAFEGVEQLAELQQAGNGRAPAPSAVAGANGQPSAQPIVAPPRKRRNPPATTSSAPQTSSDSAGPTQTLAQQNEVLQDIVKSLKTLKQEVHALSQKRSLKQSKKLESDSALGKLALLRQEISRLTLLNGSQ